MSERLHSARTSLGLLSFRLFRRLDQKPPRSKGMALVIVLATVAVLTTSVMSYVYNTRINLSLAQNHRDEVKAYFLARSGVNLQMLSLNYQYELEEEGGFIGQAMQRSNFQLWEFLDLLLPTFANARLDAGEIGSLDLEETGATGFGGLYGDITFHPPSPEDGKVNINAFAGTTVDQEMLTRFCSLLRLPYYDGGLSIDDEAAQADRFEIIASIIDYVDPDSDLTTLDANCVVSGGGAGNETSRYMDVDWEPKNEAIITIGEMRLIPGVTEEFMENFRDNLTVYPVPGKFFPNIADAQGFAGFLCSHLRGVDDDVNPCVLPLVSQQVAWLALALDGYVNFFADKMNLLNFYLGFGAFDGGSERVGEGFAAGAMIGFRRPRDFTSTLRTLMSSPETALMMAAYSDPEVMRMYGFAQATGQSFQPPEFTIRFDESAMESRIDVSAPRIFTVSSTGRYGSAQRTISAVIDFRNDPQLLYWREF